MAETRQTRQTPLAGLNATMDNGQEATGRQFRNEPRIMTVGWVEPIATEYSPVLGGRALRAPNIC
jgi:hypothetical protein